MHPPPCFEDQKKLKMESGISHNYISTDKDTRLFGLKIININMIQKLGYIFTSNFWIWIPFTVLISDDIFWIPELLGVIIDFWPQFQGL